MDEGGVSSAGKRRSKVASTARRSSSKKAGSLIAQGKRLARGGPGDSRFALFFRVKRLSGKFAVSLPQQNFDASLGFFQLLLTLARKRNAFFEQLHGVVERELWTFQSPHHFFEARERALKIRLLRWFGFLGGG